MGPVSYAGQCIISARVADGLRELTPDGLLGGFERGISEVARRAGLRTKDVEALLPVVQARYLAQRLQDTQARADAAWQTHAGHVGGLLAGIAELTADGRVPDVGECLQRLAGKVSRDRALADPLRELAGDVERWQELIATCGRQLDESGNRLVRAYQRRRLMRLGAVIVAALAILVSMAVVVWVAAARTHVDQALAAADPCDADKLEPRYANRASTAQRAQLEQRRVACREGKLAAERAAADARKAAQEAQERERVLREREELCGALADHVEAGAIPDSDAATAGEALAVLGRAARKTLDLRDLGPDDVTLPCQEVPAGARLREAFARAVLANPIAWANAEVLSPLVGAILVEHKAELSPARMERLGGHAEEQARAALLSGDAARMERAAQLCRLKQTLGVEVRGSSTCAKLLEMNPG